METDFKKDSGTTANMSLLRKSKPIEGSLLLKEGTLISHSTTTDTEATTTKEQEKKETFRVHFEDAAELELREVVSEQ